MNNFLVWIVLFTIAFAFAGMAETINIDGLLDIDNIFSYANLLLSALIPVVLLSLGFSLARYVVKFVMKVFNSL